MAFQLTNIIRDVKEDAGLGRVYLPQEDLTRFGVSAPELRKGSDLARVRPVLELEAERARKYYRSADRLIPMIEPDSQAALWILVTIYRRLLDKIAARGYEVFSKRVRLSRWEKTVILSRGLLRRTRA